jgi:hypothetical protein
MRVSGELHAAGKEPIFFPRKQVGYRAGLDAVGKI